jgi:hypothetical protein
VHYVISFSFNFLFKSVFLSSTRFSICGNHNIWVSIANTICGNYNFLTYLFVGITTYGLGLLTLYVGITLPTCIHLCRYIGKVTMDSTSQSVIGKIVEGMTTCTGRETKSEASKLLPCIEA